MKVACVLVALVACGGAVAQNETNATDPDPVPDPLPSMPAGGMPAAGMNAMAAVYMQQQFSSTYATALMEMQAAYIWTQAASGIEKMASVSVGSKPDAGIYGLEE